MILLDKAMQYANDVVSGKERTTKEVRIQCRWFLRDLERQKEDNFPYYFDEEELETVDGLLNLMNFATGLDVVGKTILDGMVNFHAFFIANIFGWRFKDNKQKFKHRDVTLFIPRKNAKTFLAAVVFIILLLTETSYSEFYSICLDRELATKVKDAMSQIITKSPALVKYFKISKTLSGKIECNLTHSFYQARTSESGRNNSIMPSAFIADEVGNFKDNKNISAMKSGQLNVVNPLRFSLTTAYAEDQSIFIEELDYIKKVFDEVIFDDRMFALLYYADPEHLWDDIGLEMSNPLRIESNYKEIRDNRKKALEKPSEREEFLTKHMNHFVPANSGEAFITVDELRKCKVDSIKWKGREVYLGLDLAMTNDNVAVAMAAEEDGILFGETVGFIPKERIAEKSKLENEDYKRYIEKGWCHACGDYIIDYLYVENFIMEIEEKYEVTVMGLGYDRYNCISTAQKLEAHGIVTVEVKQHSSVTHMPTKLLQESMQGGTFRYTENLMFEVNCRNAKCTEDTNKNKYVNKKKSSGKVDMLVALINAVYLLQQEMLYGTDDFGAQVG